MQSKIQNASASPGLGFKSGLIVLKSAAALIAAMAVLYLAPAGPCARVVMAVLAGAAASLAVSMLEGKIAQLVQAKNSVCAPAQQSLAA